MRLASREQIREIDLLTQKVYEVSSEILMESAGCSAAREIDQAFYPELKRGKIAIVCGPGNNGGDGLVLARHLHSLGHRDLDIFYLAPEEKRSELFKKQLRRAELHGIRWIDLEKSPEKLEQVRSSKFIVDALFGVGLDREIQGPFLKVIDALNSCKVPIVSLDSPSGLDCNRGVVLGGAVHASMTITFGLAKPGFFVSDGPRHVGRLRVMPIGFPFEVLRGVATTHYGFNERLARRYLPKRADTSNKSHHGHLLVIAGQPGMWGAGVLCAQAAQRVGTGYVTFASFSDPKEILPETPELLTATVEDPDLWKKKFSAIAIGPGIGVHQKSATLIERLKKEGFSRVVLDADAITTCAQFGLLPLPKTWIVTPHSGELSRILKVSAHEIELDRFHYALKGSEVMGCNLLLKGYRSILTVERRCMIILAGNSALAKAGTGDVLTGMIGGFLAQRLPQIQATATAAYIHGRMADEWVRIGHDKRALTPSDLRDHLPVLMGRLASGALI